MIKQIVLERLLLKPLDVEHKNLYYELHSNPALMRHICSPLSFEKSAQSFATCIKLNNTFNEKRLTWCINHRQSNNDIGIVGLNFESKKKGAIGTIILSEFHNNGYATEVISGVESYALDSLGMRIFSGYSTLNNEASVRLMLGLGYSIETNDMDNTRPLGNYWLKQY